jgi:hypothetical protein
MRGGEAFAMVVRNVSHGMGSARNLAAWANACSAPGTLPKIGEEEGEGCEQGWPACVQHCAHGLAWAGSVSERRQVEWTRCTHKLGQASGMLLDCKGVV